MFRRDRYIMISDHINSERQTYNSQLTHLFIDRPNAERAYINRSLDQLRSLSSIKIFLIRFNNVMITPSGQLFSILVAILTLYAITDAVRLNGIWNRDLQRCLTPALKPPRIRSAPAGVKRTLLIAQGR